MHRIERVVPLYWLMTSAAAILLLRHPTPGVEGMTYIAWLLKSYLFVPYSDDPMSGGSFRPLLGVGWTLNYEMFFYAIFALCLTARSRGWAVGLAISCLVLVVVVGRVLLGPWQSDPTDIFEFWSYPIVLLFAAGMMLGLYRKHLSIGIMVPSSATVATLLALPVIAWFWISVQVYPVTMSWRFLTWGVCVLIVTATIALQRDRAVTVSKSFLEKLGDASYSTYLCHPLILKPAWSHGLNRLPPALGFIACIVIAHLVGLAVFRFIERPLIQKFRESPRRLTA